MSPEERKMFNEMYEFYQRHKSQQITFPLDETSKEVVYENIPRLIRASTATVTANGHLIVRINGKRYKIPSRL